MHHLAVKIESNSEVQNGMFSVKNYVFNCDFNSFLKDVKKSKLLNDWEKSFLNNVATLSPFFKDKIITPKNSRCYSIN